MGAAITTLACPEWTVRRLAGAMPLEHQGQAFAGTSLKYLSATLLAGFGGLALWLLRVGRLNRAAQATFAAGLSVALYAALSTSFWFYVDDDAGITFTYARNLTDGFGLVLNPGGEKVEGYSNPLWLLLLAGARCIGLDIVTTSKTLGLLFGAAAILATHRVLTRQAARRSEWALLAPVLVALSPPFVIWNNSGLENSLHALLLIGLVGALAAGRWNGGRATLIGSILGLLSLSRPEGCLFTAASGLFILFSRRSGRPSAREWLLVVSPALAVMAGLTLFRIVYFHDVLPNTFYAKATQAHPFRILNPFSGGWRYVAEGAAAGGWTLMLIPVALLLLRRSTWPPVVLPALVVLGTHLFFVVSVNGDWMMQYRFLSPAIPMMAMLAVLGLSCLFEALQEQLRGAGRAGVVCLLPVAGMMLVAWPQMVAFAARPTTPMETVGEIGRYFQDLAARLGVKHPTLLAHDAGGTSYVARLHLIDLGALCDRTIARHRHDRERIRQYIFYERKPTFIFSAKVFADQVGLEQFEELARDYTPLPPAPRPSLDAYLRLVRGELASRLLNPSPIETGAPCSRPAETSR